MYQQDIATDNKELMLKINVSNNAPSDHRVFIKIRDWKKPNTFYTNRYYDMKKGETKDFFVRMPISPKVATVMVYNTKNPQDNAKIVANFIQPMPLTRKFSVYDFQNKDVTDFVLFAQKFSDNAGILSEGDYFSDTPSSYGKFRIIYTEYVVDKRYDETGRLMVRKMTTPSRINTTTGVIEAARYRFVTYSVPMRMAILLHEFCHIYINKDQSNETEADLNSLLIYLGLGYPRIDALRVWLEVFYNAARDSNKERYKKIYNFIMNFEQIDLKLLK